MGVYQPRAPVLPIASARVFPVLTFGTNPPHHKRKTLGDVCAILANGMQVCSPSIATPEGTLVAEGKAGTAVPTAANQPITTPAVIPYPTAGLTILPATSTFSLTDLSTWPWYLWGLLAGVGVLIWTQR